MCLVLSCNHVATFNVFIIHPVCLRVLAAYKFCKCNVVQSLGGMNSIDGEYEGPHTFYTHT